MNHCGLSVIFISMGTVFLGDLETLPRQLYHQFWSLVFVTCRSEISTSGANRKKRAGVFFRREDELLAKNHGELHHACGFSLDAF